MSPKIILVDYENVPGIDLSILDDSFRATIFVGARQNPPKASRKKATEHRFARVDFQKIDGSGKNALDFHIAFELGRIFVIAPKTECFVLSRDKGFDPLLSHLKRNGLQCRRVTSISEIVPDKNTHRPAPNALLCRRCGKASTIEHLGGRWCSNCGDFSQPPDPARMPSNSIGYVEPQKGGDGYIAIFGECAWCYERKDMTGGFFEEGEWMCGDCVASHAR